MATVAINNSTNAALLAVRILGAADPVIQTAMAHYMAKMENEVEQKRQKMQSTGWIDYQGLK